MNLLTKIAGSNNSTVKYGSLLLLLLGIIGVSYLIATKGVGIGVLATGGFISIAMAILCVTIPQFGFYLSYISAFFIFDVIRFFQTDLPLVSGIDVLVYLTFLGVLVKKMIQREAFWKNCRSVIVVMYLIIIAYYLIEFFNPNSISREIYFLLFRRFITLLLFFYCAIQLFTDFDKIKRFFQVTLFLGILCGVYGCYQKWAGIPAYVDRYYSSRNVLGLGRLENGEMRIGSFLPDCTAFGLLMSGIIIIALAFFLNKQMSRINKAILVMGILAMMLSMSYSGTRTATAMLIVEVVLYILMTSTQRKTIVFSLFFGALFAVVMFAPSYGNTTLNRLKSTFESEDESLKVRDNNREFIQPYIYANPIGGGVGTSGVVYYEYNVGHPLAGFPTDSGLLAMALEFGWVGLLIQCITYFFTLQQGIIGYFRAREKKFKVYFLAATICIFGYIVAQYSQIAIGQIPGGFMFYCLTAVIIRLRQLDAKTI